MSENLESVMRRIEKLLAIANDDRTNPNEAASAAAMAEKIMRKYQIEHADIIAAKLKAGDDMEEATVIATAKTNGTRVEVVPAWAGQIALQVGYLNDVIATVGRDKAGNACVRFSGFSADVQIAKFTFEYLVATVNRLCNEFKKTDTYLTFGRRAVNSYRAGVASGICYNLIASINMKKAEVQNSTAGTSLMVVKAQVVAERFGKQTTKSTSSSVARGDSYYQGRLDGKAVDVNRRGVTSQSDNSRLIK